MARSQFIMVDGLTGSGKTTVLKAVRSWSERCGHRIFDLAAWCAEHRSLPRYEEIADFDTYFTFEPTKVWVGSAIREELSRTDLPYTGLELAHAFSLDRLVLYRRLILPALADGKCVIQDRGVSTSIAYQPAMPQGPTLEALLDLPGNRLAMEHRPDHLILTSISPEEAIARATSRGGESKGVFEDVELMRAIDTRYHAAWFTNLFAQQGSSVHCIDMNGTIEQTQTRAVSLVSHILPAC